MTSTILGILSTAMFGIFGWAFNINTKVTAQDLLIKNLKDNQQNKDDSFEKLFTVRFDSLDKRLERIERHVLNGHYERHD